MRLLKAICALIVFGLSSCFWGADSYERSVNNYFWLYSPDWNPDIVCLGHIEDEKYRFSSPYICDIYKIGWDKSHLTCLTAYGAYYIQELRPLKNKWATDFSRYLYGPLTKLAFERKRDSLGVDEDLDFDITY